MDQDNLRFKVLFNFAYVPAAAEATSSRGWRALEFQPVDSQENTSTSEPSEPPEAECGENSDEDTICTTLETSPPPKKELQIGMRNKFKGGIGTIKDRM